MLKIKTVIVCLIPLLFISASCEKEDQEPEFKQGFSCKINGEEWIAKTPASIGGPVPLNVSFDENTGLLFLQATKKDNEQNIYDFIHIFVDDVYEKGTYNILSLNEDGKEIAASNYENPVNGCSGFTYNSSNPGNFKVCLFEKEKRELSGTFNMTLINRNCQDSLLNITDGKFSFNY